MASNKNDNIRLLAPKPIDERYFHPSNRPWNSVSEALSGITYRHQGLMVNISGTIYWFRNGVLDIDLVIFIPEIDIPEIINNLTTQDSTKTLSAEMGYVLRQQIQTIETILNSDDTSLDTLQEIVDRIKLINEGFDTLDISDVGGLQNALNQINLTFNSIQTELNGKEPSFTKNTAFNKNFGTGSDDIPRGNDSRINNGQTAYTWGDHAQAGYQKALISNPDIYIDQDGNIYPNITDFTENFTWNEGDSKTFNVAFQVTQITNIFLDGEEIGDDFDFSNPSTVTINRYMDGTCHIRIQYQHFINAPE